MRTKLIMLGIISLSLGACTSSRTQSGVAYNDDIYYNPKAKPLSVSDQFAPVLTDKAVQKEDQQVYSQKAKEYSRSVDQSDPRDFSQIQAQYANILTDDQVVDVDTMVYYNDETGYWVNGFSGSSYDQDYAERLVKFHGPFRGIPYWSPLYTQVVYFGDPNWNVYLDGNYAYVFPSWSNRFYSNFYFGGYRSFWNTSFGFGWPYYGWNDSWYNPYFGFGGYDPYWGYNPYWHGSHYWPHHHRPGGNIAGNQTSPSRYYGSRTGNNNTSIGSVNSSTSYRSSNTRYSSYSPANGSREMTVTRDGNTVSTRGSVTYSRPGSTVNGTTNKNTSTGVGNTVTNNAVRNSSATRGSSQRSGTTVTNRYSSGGGNSSTSGSSSRPTYQPGSATRSTTVERNVNNNTMRSGSSTPASNSSSYTPSRSGSSSSGSSNQRTNRR